MKLKVNGASLRVEVDGPGAAPAVLMWNGAQCTVHMWDAVVPKLADRYRCIRFDIRGTGQSTPTEDPATQYSFEQYAEDALAILDEVGVESSYIWSMAWGSRAALAFASMHPERVRLAAFYDASIGAADVAAQAAGRERALALQDAAGIERFRPPRGWSQHANPDSVRPALAAAAKFDLPAVVPSLKMPILVATGDHDPNLPSSRELVERAPDARLVVLENVGHGSVLQRPDLTSEIFLEFAGSISQI